MKTGYDSLNRFGLFSIMVVISFLFTSCDFYHFSQPQPYDKEKIYQFPDEFLGKWKAKDTVVYGFEFTVPLDGKGGDHFNIENDQQNKTMFGKGDGDSGFYCIYRNYLIMVIVEKDKILTGAWPKLNNKNELVYPPLGFGRLYEINYDSLNKPVDTVSNYIISGNKIYEKEPDRFLLPGYDHTRVKDTITILKKDSIYIDLGQNAFLRKLTDSLYVFNINNSILELSEGEKWWKLMILEIDGNGKINQWECNTKTGELPCMFYGRPSKSDQFYFDCLWSTAEMLRLMKEGYFDKTVVLEKMDK
jgi:hypothetical protein